MRCSILYFHSKKIRLVLHTTSNNDDTITWKYIINNYCGFKRNMIHIYTQFQTIHHVQNYIEIHKFVRYFLSPEIGLLENKVIITFLPIEQLLWDTENMVTHLSLGELKLFSQGGKIHKGPNNNFLSCPLVNTPPMIHHIHVLYIPSYFEYFHT